MKLSEATKLLGVMNAYDKRTTGPTDDQAWHLMLRDLPFEDCRDVVIAHYRNSTDYLMPVHVITGVRRLHRDRLERTVPMPDADPDDVQAWLAEYRADIKAIAVGDELREKRHQLVAREPRDMNVIEGTFGDVR